MTTTTKKKKQDQIRRTLELLVFPIVLLLILAKCSLMGFANALPCA